MTWPFLNSNYAIQTILKFSRSVCQVIVEGVLSAVRIIYQECSFDLSSPVWLDSTSESPNSHLPILPVEAFSEIDASWDFQNSQTPKLASIFTCLWTPMVKCRSPACRPDYEKSGLHADQIEKKKSGLHADQIFTHNYTQPRTRSIFEDYKYERTAYRRKLLSGYDSPYQPC